MLRIVVWDVQHGSAAYIKTPNGKNIAVDLGTGSYGYGMREFSPLLHLRDHWGVNQIDAVIVTHPHRDHLDDISQFDLMSPSLLTTPRHLTDQEVYSGNTPESRATIAEYLGIRKRYSTSVVPGSTIDPFHPLNNGNVHIVHFIPSGCSRANLNDHSIVMVVSYGGWKVVIPGDNEACSWNELMGNSEFVSAVREADVLFAPHHGRASGFHAPLFRIMNPFLVVVSDGDRVDTSAVSRYSAVSQGWAVYKRRGGSEARKCLTTRNDGVIVLDFQSDLLGRANMKVTID